MYKKNNVLEKNHLTNDVSERNVLRLFFSHHPPEHINRTLKFTIFDKRIHLCARCSGLMMGLFSGVLLVNIFNSSITKINDYILTALIFLLILPAIIDFITQLINGIESNNMRRVITGGLFGLSLRVCIWSLLRELFFPFLVFITTFIFIGIWFFTSPDRTKKMIEHLKLYSDYYYHCKFLDLSNKLKGIRK